MSTRPPCPEGMSWVSPYLTVKNVEAAIGWYEKAFGFEAKYTMPGPDGKAVHGEVTWQGHSVMVGAEGAYGGKTQTPLTTGVLSPVSLYVYVPSVDALYERAKAAGAKVENPPQDMFWGDRICGITDPDGHSWCFATNVSDWDPSKTPG